MTLLGEKGFLGFPKMVAHGKIHENVHYFILTKYGNSLKQLQRCSKNNQFSVKTSVQIGIQLLKRLESLHSIGYIHNDIKPDNILVESSNRKSF